MSIRVRRDAFGVLAVVFAGLLACKSGDTSREDDLRRKEQDLREREAKLKEQQAAPSPSPTPPTETASDPVQPAVPRPSAPAGAREVTVGVSLVVDLAKPGGQPWDAAGDAADPTLTVQSSSGQTDTKWYKDTQTANAQFTLKLSVGDSVTVTAVDKDLTAHDPIGTFTAKYAGPGSSGKGRNGAGAFTITFH
ncbi:MAG: hypothetical protein IPI67_26795 [Myxococcales bacterium]|nr:hypothetical protein [Myxococcales bacterium]